MSSNITGGNTLTLAGNVNLSESGTTGRILYLTGAGSMRISGTIQDYSGGVGTAHGALTISNSDTTTLAGANTYGGLTTLDLGAGTVILAGSNNSGGATKLTGGTLQLNNAANGGLATGTLSLNGGTLQSLLPAQTLSNKVSLTGNSKGSGTNSITFNGDLTNSGGNRTLTSSITGGNTLTLAGNVNLSESGTTGRTLTLDGMYNTLITGTIQDYSDGVGTAHGGLTITSYGTVTLAGANTYGGLTSLTWGTLILAGSNNSGGGTTLTGGTLQLNNAANGGLATGPLSLSGGTLQSLLPSQAISNSVTLTSLVNVSGTNSITFNGAFTNSGSNRTLTSSITGGNTLTLAGNVNLSEIGTTGRTLYLAGTGNTRISGTIQDYSGGVGTAHGGLTISGFGTVTLTLAGANTYGGLTTLNSEAGTLILAGSNNSGGATTLTSGTLQLNNAANGGLATGTLALNGGALQSLLPSQAISNPVSLTGFDTISGANSITFNGDVTNFGGYQLINNITGGNTLTLAGNVNLSEIGSTGRTLYLNGSGNTLITGTIRDYSGGVGTAHGGLVIISISTGTVTLAGANTYGGLTEVSRGTLILAGRNNSGGATTLSGGTSQLNNAANGGLATGTLTLSGGTLQSLLPSQALSNSVSLTDGSTVSGANSITLNGAFTNVNNNRTLTSSITGGNTLTLAGKVNLSESGTIGRMLTLAGTGNTLIRNTIQDYSGGVGAAHGGLTISNTGTTTLTGANTYGGDTTVNGGTLSVTGAGRLGSGNYAGNLLLSSGTLRYNSTMDQTLSGVISGGGSVIQAGSGMLTLTGSNLYTGGTTLSAGTLTAGNSSAFGLGSVTLTGGTLALGDIEILNTINNNGGTILMATSTMALAANLGSGSQYKGVERVSTGLIGTSTASLLAGNAGGARSVTSSWSSDAHGNAGVKSDVLTLNGTGNDLFVLQMSSTGVVADACLAWYNPGTNQWVNAVLGNDGGTGTLGASYTTAFNQGTMFSLGSWGVDAANGVVWAVINHNSEFAVAVVPEPAVPALLALGGLTLLRRRRVDEKSSGRCSAVDCKEVL